MSLSSSLWYILPSFRYDIAIVILKIENMVKLFRKLLFSGA